MSDLSVKPEFEKLQWEIAALTGRMRSVELERDSWRARCERLTEQPLDADNQEDGEAESGEDRAYAAEQAERVSRETADEEDREDVDRSPEIHRERSCEPSRHPWMRL